MHDAGGGNKAGPRHPQWKHCGRSQESKTLPDQIAAVREALEEIGEVAPEQIARRFSRARSAAVQPLLDSLAALGQAERVEADKYAA